MNRTIPVSRLQKGETARVTAFGAMAGNHLRKLTAFGILPGTLVKVLQTYPVYVLQVNFTELAVDREIASMIFVENNEKRRD
ncbi:MAG: ferrous iron transport protein A [Negativicutes bacterium]|nr:ferrous iron transport protein A [Negativicutes bacterium]